MTGRCQHLGGKGETAAELVRNGGTYAHVVLDVVNQSFKTISREVPNSLQVGDLTGNTSFQQQWLYNTLGVTDDLIQASLRSWKFTSMKPPEQNTLLFDLLGITLDGAAVIEGLNRQQANLGDFWAFYANGVKKDGEYERCYSERATAKKLLKTMNDKIMGSNLGPEPPPVPPGALDTHRKAWKDVAEKIAALEAQGKGGRELYTSRHNEWVSDTERKAELAEKVKYLKAGIEQIDADNAFEVPEVKNMLKRLADLRQEVGLLDMETTQAKVLLHDALESDEPCPTGKCLRAGIKDLQRLMEEKQAQLQAKGSALQKLEVQVTEANTMGRARKEADDRKKNLTNALKDAQAAFEKLKVGEEPILNTGSASEVDSLRSQQQKIEAQAHEIEAAQAAHSAWAAGKQRLTDLEADHAAQKKDVQKWEALVEAFGPKGIRAQMLSEAMEPLCEVIDEALVDLLPGGSIEFEAGEAFDIWVSRGDLRLRFSHLSKSEQLRTAIAIQVGVNALTNLGLLVIDDAENLDDDCRGVLLEVLLQVSEQFDNVIVLEAKTKRPDALDAPGLGWYWVEGGKVEAI